MKVQCKTQAECDAVLAVNNLPELVGSGYFVIRGTARVVARGSSHVEAWGSSHVEAWGSSHVEARESSHVEARESSHVVARESSHVDAWGSSHVVARESSHVVARGSSHVEARGSSHVEARESSHVVARGSSHVEAWGSSHVEAWGSSHVEAWGSSHVEAWGSSHVVARESSHVVARESSHVEARGSSHVNAWESSHVVASKFVATHIHSKDAEVKGGVRITVRAPRTPREWCDYYGAKVEKGFAILFKAVRDDFRSAHGFLYQPGTTPACLDWNAVPECGGGLHFCALPSAAKEFDNRATRFLACPIKLSDIVVHQNANYPNKVKASRISKPIYEVDIYGNPK